MFTKYKSSFGKCATEKLKICESLKFWNIYSTIQVSSKFQPVLNSKENFNVASRTRKMGLILTVSDVVSKSVWGPKMPFGKAKSRKSHHTDRSRHVESESVQANHQVANRHIRLTCKCCRPQPWFTRVQAITHYLLIIICCNKVVLNVNF